MSCSPVATAATAVAIQPPIRTVLIATDYKPVVEPGNTDEWDKIRASLPDEVVKRVEKRSSPGQTVFAVWRPSPDLELYWGGEDGLKDTQSLVALGVTHILTARRMETNDPRFVPFKHMIVPALDSETQDMLQYFPETNRFIGEAFKEKKAVYVHCAAGISRSVTFVIAYLMATTKMMATAALELTRSARADAFPNTGFREQLELYGKLGTPADMENCKGYQRWLYDREVSSKVLMLEAPQPETIFYGDEHPESNGIASTNAGTSADSGTGANGAQENLAKEDVDIRCRKCR